MERLMHFGEAKKVAQALGFCLFVLLWVPAMLALGAENDQSLSRCGKVGGDEVIAQMLQELEWAKAVIPNVPPEEASFLEQESKSASSLYSEGNWQQSEARYTALDRRPMYHVWVLRDKLTQAHSKVAEIPRPWPSYMKNVQASKLQAAADALHSVNGYVLELDRFVRNEQLQSSLNSISVKQRYRLELGKQMPDDLGHFIGCRLEKIMRAQKQ
jgi:hypothetical protein